MNIKQAKQYIKDTAALYLKKDAYGEYRIPVVRQRPIFLLGAPGIGKTAIMEQIAQELGIALVSYSMTHHTRQSALGLPFITTRTYGGQEYSVSEYTMSEIIASVYDTMEESGIREGILFLDEINCVSETLAPSMLQFLQYKVFGRHRVPEGWIIVTAGNPPQFNKSVREFDVVTYDRLKLLEVEPDLHAWREYALEQRIHGAVTSYLELKKEHFYCMEMTPKGRSYVTARGWEDLSTMLGLYEEESLPVEEALVGQYLRNERVVKEFTAYYELYNRYRRDYRIEEILTGKPPAGAVARAREAAFDERLSLLGMLLDRVQADMRECCEEADVLTELLPMLRSVKALAETGTLSEIEKRLELLAEGRQKLLASLQAANSLSDADRGKHRSVKSFLEALRGELYSGGAASAAEGFLRCKSAYDDRVAAMKEKTGETKRELSNLFAFAEEAFGEGNEMLILVTELTVNVSGARFIASFGCPEYQRHNRELMLGERSEELLQRVVKLELD